MDLDRLQQDWNDLARKDAMWAVLTGPAGTARRWDPDAFFRTGTDEIDALLHRLEAAGATPRRGRALDFGCGVGRLTQALAGHFTRTDGVDISAVMIEQARQLNRRGEACAYHVNGAADLRLFADGLFDFVYSSITLQHMAPAFSRGYIGEFFRVATPGGLVVFQIPSHTVDQRPQTRQQGALPVQDCRASLSTATAVRCAPGAALPIRVIIRNQGTRVWSSSGREDDAQFAVRLGNHWRGRFGRMRVFDDLRTGLPFDLAPGETMEVGITPTAPSRPGVWNLELDMVQEYVRWFAEAGSKPARVRVHVDARLAPGTVEGLPAVMEMHGLPRAEVESLVAGAGGSLLAVEDDDSPGPGWVSYRYIARRIAG